MPPPEETRWDFHAYDRTVVDAVWANAQPVVGNDAALWRKDECGAWIHRLEYGSRSSQFGWEIYDPNLAPSQFGLAALRPLQWQNYLDKVAFENAFRMTADGLRNVRRLL
ncbi:MAG: hypothetical protein KA004_01965 [Verrucomicrobiales bacterium]|nr:hypothetical protein [Verrucomicrobiales bacterium]